VNASAINDAGQIVAWARNDSGMDGAVLLSPCAGALIGSLVEIIRSYELPQGLENSLVTKLENALAALAVGDTETACGLVGAFVNETQAQDGKKLTAEQAGEMIDGAEAIRAAIGCP